MRMKCHLTHVIHCVYSFSFSRDNKQRISSITTDNEAILPNIILDSRMLSHAQYLTEINYCAKKDTTNNKAWNPGNIQYNIPINLRQL